MTEAIQAAESLITSFRNAGSYGCPLCGATNTLILPLPPMLEDCLKKAVLHVPERCLRCGAEWSNVFVFNEARLTTPGRPMPQRKSKKPSTGPASMPQKHPEDGQPMKEAKA